ALGLPRSAHRAALARVAARVEVARVRVERRECRVDGLPENRDRFARLRLQRLDRLQRRGEQGRHVHIAGVRAGDAIEYGFEEILVEVRLLARLDGTQVGGGERGELLPRERCRSGKRAGGGQQQAGQG